MIHRRKIGLIFLMALFTVSWGESPKNQSTQAVLLEPGTMWVVNLAGEMSVISMGYERKIPGTPFSFQLHLHGGYDADEYYDTSWALGAGFTMRRYFGQTFEGAFGQAQFDYVRGEHTTTLYAYNNGMSGSPYDSFTVEKSLFVPQLSFGYKWQNSFFILEGSLGGAIYLTPAEKWTSLSVSLNVGAPF